ELTLKRVGNIDDLSVLLKVDTIMDGSGGSYPGTQTVPRHEKTKGPKLVPPPPERTKNFPGKDAKPQGKSVAKASALPLHQKILAVFRPAGKWSPAVLSGGAVIALLLAFGAYKILHRSSVATPNQPVLVQYAQVTVDPPDSTVTVNGAPMTD